MPERTTSLRLSPRPVHRRRHPVVRMVSRVNVGHSPECGQDDQRNRKMRYIAGPQNRRLHSTRFRKARAQIIPVGALAEINTIKARASFLRSPLQTPQTGEKNAMPKDETGTLDAHKLRELAAWYREFAERAEPSVREARLRIAEQLERDADLLEGKR